MCVCVGKHCFLRLASVDDGADHSKFCTRQAQIAIVPHQDGTVSDECFHNYYVKTNGVCHAGKQSFPSLESPPAAARSALIAPAIVKDQRLGWKISHLDHHQLLIAIVIGVRSKIGTR